MRKYLLILGLLICNLAQTNAQQLSESFEESVFPPSGWKALTIKGENPWRQSPVKRKSGTYSAFVNYELLANGYLGLGEHWLITPKVSNIQSTDKITFSIAASQGSYPIPPPYYDSLYVYVSTTGNNPEDFELLAGKINLDSNKYSFNFITYSFNFPAAVHGQDVYIGFKHVEYEGNGIFIDDISAGSKLGYDAKATKLNRKNTDLFPANEPVGLTLTISNNGTNSIPAGVPVSYMVDGVLKHTANTTTSLAPNATTQITFAGSSAFTPPAPGSYEIKLFSSFPLDANKSNDTLTYVMNVQAPKTAFPYFMYFDNMADWTNAGNFDFELLDFNTTTYEPVIDPTGINSFSAYANTLFKFETGDSFLLRSPLLNFSGLTTPMLNFYVSSRNILAHSDLLEVVVSTDGGATYGAPLYSKSDLTTPKLRTVYSSHPSQHYFFSPEAANQWRHEIIDLSAYAGNPNVMIIFKVLGGRGNNVFIDDVKIFDQPAALYTEALVSSPGVVTGAFNTQVDFVTVPVADYVRIQGHDQIPDHFLDEAERFDAAGAITPSGDPLVPNYVYPRYFTIAYSGNTENHATYNISLDYNGLSPISNPDSLVIMKRSDEGGKWIALNTTRSGTILTATGLTNFSDFAIGTWLSPVPVSIQRFSGVATPNSIALSWTTAQESNIFSYDIQRLEGQEWVTIGNRASVNSTVQHTYSFEDRAPQAGMNLYRLRINGEVGGARYSEVAKVMWSVSANTVYQNVPNPLKNQTVIRYDLANSAHVKVVIYDTRGTQISVLEQAVKGAGMHQVIWDAGNLPSGTYFYSVIIDGTSTTKSMLKVK